MSTRTRVCARDPLCRMAEGWPSAKQLLRTEREYDRRKRAQDALITRPVLLTQHESTGGACDMACTTLPPERSNCSCALSPSNVRLAVIKLLTNLPNALSVFGDTDEEHWRFYLDSCRYGWSG